MKKRLITVLLILVLIMSAGIVPAGAAGGSKPYDYAKYGQQTLSVAFGGATPIIDGKVGVKEYANTLVFDKDTPGVSFSDSAFTAYPTDIKVHMTVDEQYIYLGIEVDEPYYRYRVGSTAGSYMAFSFGFNMGDIFYHCMDRQTLTFQVYQDNTPFYANTIMVYKPDGTYTSTYNSVVYADVAVMRDDTNQVTVYEARLIKAELAALSGLEKLPDTCYIHFLNKCFDSAGNTAEFRYRCLLDSAARAEITAQDGWVATFAPHLLTFLPPSDGTPLRMVDSFGNRIYNLKEIASPSVSFANAESHPRFLNDGSEARWSAAGYTGQDKPWVQYEFPCRISAEGIVIKWYDDGSGNRVPKEIDIQYWNGSEFVSVVKKGTYSYPANTRTLYKFNAVETTILRVVITPTGTLGGDGKGMPAIAEWNVVGSLAEGAVVPKPEMTGISRIAVPSAAFAYKTDFVYNLNDNTDAYWSAYGYTDTNKPWVQYKLPVEVALNGCVVRWYDDGSNIRAPKSIDIQYWNGTEFVSVNKIGAYSYVPNQDNTYKFESINTRILRIVITPAGELGGDGKGMPGIVEWNVIGYLLMEYTKNDLEKTYITSLEKEPATGDTAVFVVAVMEVSAVSLAALIIRRRKRCRSN